ncbi:MAG TPA: YdcF family protein [Pyrinomonadaceae bacterium]|nr:YdcF family protein [Pyrinomonadaceae bacterium]
MWLVFAPLLANHLIFQKTIEKPDAIVVLAGSSQYPERCRKAAELYHERQIPVIYLTNDGERSGWSVAEKRNIPYLELERRELIANGVFADSIRVLDGVVKGTDDEAKAMAAEAKAANLRSVLIVTSSYHSRRAYRTFERMFADSGIEIGIEHAPLADDDPSPMWWWLSRRGWQLVGGEYVKSAVYWAYS